MAKTNQGRAQHNNKLSRSYRFKKKFGKVKKRIDDNSNEKNQIKKARIIVRNLPFTTTEADMHRLYKSFGEIEEINLLKRPDGKLIGCGFVQFKNVEDASKAIFKTNKSNFLGRTISSEWSIPKSQFYEKLKKEEATEVKDENEEEETTKVATIEDHNVEITEDSSSKHKKRKNSKREKNALSKAEQRKLYKLKKRQKRSRIIVRNLPFTITEEGIKEHFKKYGNIEDLKMLKTSNGKLIGCCFIQFDRVQSAAQAIHYENMKLLCNRPIIVDWAIAKDKYEKSNGNVEIKTEKNEDAQIIKVKEEDNEDEVKIKEEKDSDEDEIKDGSSEEEHSEGEDSNDNSDDDDDNEDVDDKKDIKLELDSGSVTSISYPRRISNDVTEGKTVFIKNVPFSAKNEDLKECMEQFGPVYYALICMDSLTEHSKGTAFVKFRNVEDAEKCLAAGTELKLHDQVLDPHRALHRNEVKQKSEEKNKKVKDSRNLFLVKEGVILAGSPSAEGVSAADMARRLQLEQWKSQMLRNLNMFVSRVRLVIQNLPPTVDDAKLRQLFKNHSNSNAVITEARVMRDLRNVDASGIGKSKEYGFVSFTNHEDALKTLRSINNNPNIFTKAKRPIVAFSIENRIMVNAKQKRLESSRQHNPLWGDRKRSANNNQEQKNNDDSLSKKKQFKKKRNTDSCISKGTDEDMESFAGTTGKFGVNKANSKFFLKKQAALHSENLKMQKKKAKSLKQLTNQKREQATSRREAKPKQGSKKPNADEVNFNRLVDNYKKKLSSVLQSKSKWYET